LEPGLPRPPGEQTPVFAHPWQAQVFALVVALHARGVFTWSEWAAALSAELAAPDALADGSDGYLRWLAALEKICADKGIATSGEVEAMTLAWQRAARATPHGEPVRLENDPMRLTGHR